MSFPNHPPPPSQSFSKRSFFEGDVGSLWPQYQGNIPNFPFNVENPEFSSQFDNGPPFKRPRNCENHPSNNFAPFPPSSAPRMNSSGNKGTSHIFYKTRQCVKFQEGNCKNGEHCTFAHGEKEVRDPPPNWQELVREKDKDGVSGNWNEDHRLVHKMKFCKKFYNGEECPYGERCTFLHERPNPCFREDNMRFRTEPARQRESSAISIAPRGPSTGTRGPAVGTIAEDDQHENNLLISSNLDTTRTKPVYWKTKMCSKWEITGHCPFGERCHFAHGQSGSTARVDVEVPTFYGSVPTNAGAAVPVIDSIPTSSTTQAPPVKEESGEDPSISKWKLGRKTNTIYGDWIHDFGDLTKPRKITSDPEKI